MPFWWHGWVLAVRGPRSVTADKTQSEEGGVYATPDARGKSYVLPALRRTG